MSLTESTSVKPLPKAEWQGNVPAYLLHIFPYLKWMMGLTLGHIEYDRLTAAWVVYARVTQEDINTYPFLTGIEELWVGFRDEGGA